MVSTCMPALECTRAAIAASMRDWWRTAHTVKHRERPETLAGRDGPWHGGWGEAKSGGERRLSHSDRTLM